AQGATQSVSSPASNAHPHSRVEPPVGTPPTLFATPDGKAARPTRLLIPAIGVNASVEGVEILPNGEMATPTQHPFDDVGWFDLGTKPGDRGSAVFDGHLDRPGGYPAVFWNLRNLHPGDEVLVINAEGQTLHFR